MSSLEAHAPPLGAGDRADIGVVGQATLVLTSAILAIGLFTMGVVLPRMAGTAGDQAWLLPWIGSIASPAFAVASPFAGILTARWGFRRVLVAGLLGFAVCGTLPAVIDNLWIVAALRLFVGVFVAGVANAGLAGIACLPLQRRTGLLGLQTVAASLAAAAAYPLIGLLVRGNWHSGFLIYLVALLIVPTALTLPRHKSAGNAASSIRSGRLAGVSPALLLFAICLGICLILLNLVGGFYLLSIGQRDPMALAMPLTLMAIVGGISALCYGAVHRRIGTRGAFVFGGGCIAIGLALAGTSHSPTIFAIGCMLNGCGMSTCVPNIYNAALSDAGSHSAPAVGVVNAFIYGAPILLPLLLPSLNAHLGAGGVILVMAAAMGLWAIWFARPRALPLDQAGERPPAFRVPS